MVFVAFFLRLRGGGEGIIVLYIGVRCVGVLCASAKRCWWEESEHCVGYGVRCFDLKRRSGEVLGSFKGLAVLTRLLSQGVAKNVYF